MSATGTRAGATRRPALGRIAAARDALGAAAASRLLVWVAGLVAFWTVPLSGWQRSDPTRLTQRLGEVGGALGAPAVRWDAQWYVAIARHGYESSTDLAFLPLYPLLSRTVGTLTGGSEIVGAVLVSLAAFAAALVLLHRLTRLELGDAIARRTVWLLAFFPAAVFFSAVYTEALFLALSVGAIYAARRGRWAWAGAIGAAAALTRNTGVIVLLPILLLYLYGPRDDVAPADPAAAPGRGGWRPRHALGRDAAWLLLIPAGLALFGAYSWIFFGTPFATLDAQGQFEREFAGPLSALWYAAGDAVGAVGTLIGVGGDGETAGAALRTLALTGGVIFAVVAAIGALRRLPVAYGAYAVAALIPPLSTPWPEHPLWSTPRFVAVLFPVFMWLAWRLRDRRAYLAVLGVFALGLAYCAARFATWHWVA